MKIALHICCGVCAAGAAEKLQAEGYQVFGYFYNPNIHPRAEYLRRLEAAKKVAQELGFPLESGLYQPADWFAHVRGLEGEREGGLRCSICFGARLQRTYRYMLDSGLDAFTTTLTIGPQKSAAVVNKIGREIGGDRFLIRDFKKQAGFQRASELARKWEIHRQHYCGCIFSEGER